ncbi:MAG TPA: sporulation integral membrane protein YlbJ [Clostridia bacterium]|nr:sporulation integral membrane protein YlbJ [Clostridia bacterium]
MHVNTSRRRNRTSANTGTTGTYALAAIAVLLTLFMILEPEAAFEASVTGLKVWWDIVFPALLPFFSGSEVLMGLGVVHCMGVLMEPLMRPVFNVPGAGSFVMAMGLASGYPIGAVLTAKLRKKSMCNKYEGERLMSFCNTADPLFMNGAVAVGMFRNVAVGPVIMVAHYLSALLVGVCLRFYKVGADITKVPGKRSGFVLVKALRALVEARRDDGRPFGQLIGDAIRQSVNSLLAIGGFIILFSVIIRMAEEAGALSYASRFSTAALRLVGIDPDLHTSLVGGLFEITLGTQSADQADAPLLDRVIIASAVIAWSGLSVHAQVSAMIQGTDMDMKPYVVSRMLHAVLAGIITYILWPLFGIQATPAQAVQVRPLPSEPMRWTYYLLPWATRLKLSAATFVCAFVSLIVLAALTSLPSLTNGDSRRR